MPGQSTEGAIASSSLSEGKQVLDWLQYWYAAQCDGDGEHEWGMTIGTLDNPGWSIRIDLEETDLEGREYPRRHIDRGPHDWIWIGTAEKVFQASCGPANLTETLTLFRDWATSHGPALE